MWLLILEAATAFAIFAFIIWWTMYSGRKPEEHETASDKAQTKPQTKPTADTRQDHTDRSSAP